MVIFNKSYCIALWLLYAILMTGCSAEKRPDDIGDLFKVIDRSTSKTAELNSAVKELEIILSNCQIENQDANCNLIQFYIATVKISNKRSLGQQYLIQETQ